MLEIYSGQVALELLRAERGVLNSSGEMGGIKRGVEYMGEGG